MDDKKEYIQIVEKEISLDDYPFFKLICIIGFTYGVLVKRMPLYNIAEVFKREGFKK